VIADLYKHTCVPATKAKRTRPLQAAPRVYLKSSGQGGTNGFQRPRPVEDFHQQSEEFREHWNAETRFGRISLPRWGFSTTNAPSSITFPHLNTNPMGALSRVISWVRNLLDYQPLVGPENRLAPELPTPPKARSASRSAVSEITDLCTSGHLFLLLCESKVRVFHDADSW